MGWFSKETLGPPQSEDVREEYGMAVQGRAGHAPLSVGTHKR